MNEKEYKEKKFAKLRADIYPVLHSKKRTIDDLVYMWDFFREHMVVVDSMIKERHRLPKIRCTRCHDTMSIGAKVDELTKLECHCRNVCLNMATFSSSEEFSKFLKEHDMEVVK